ncbi:MAG TPA: LPXTG cell wall anchor domain-containing protein [Bryobacteraceae bacterium]|jgi:LPXTG-motif cell wall-anchored protein
MRSKLALLFCLVLLIAMAIPASADEWNKKTTITFAEPVEIPGMVLAPGTYVFKLLNSATNRNIVLVYNEAEDHLYKMILAIPNYRLVRKDETILRFKEGVRGAPDALRGWFFPADQWGQEFVYPRTEAVLITRAAEEPVLAAAITPVETAEELAELPITVMTPEREVAVTAKEEEPFSSEEVEQALAEPSFLTTPAAATPEELPKTGSSLPLVALLGFSTAALAGLLNFTLRAR